MRSILFHRNLLQFAYLAEPGGGVNASSDIEQMENSVPREHVTICLPCRARRWCQCQLLCRADGAFCSTGTGYQAESTCKPAEHTVSGLRKGNSSHISVPGLNPDQLYSKCLKCWIFSQLLLNFYCQSLAVTIQYVRIGLRTNNANV